MGWEIPAKCRECSHPSPGPSGSSPALLGPGLVGRLGIARDGRGAQGIRAAPGAWKRRKPFGSQFLDGIDPEPRRRQKWGTGITIWMILGLTPVPGGIPRVGIHRDPASPMGQALPNSIPGNHGILEFWNGWEWTLDPIPFHGQGHFLYPRLLQAPSKLSLDIPRMWICLSGHSQIQTIPAPGTALSQTSQQLPRMHNREFCWSMALPKLLVQEDLSIIFP